MWRTCQFRIWEWSCSLNRAKPVHPCCDLSCDLHTWFCYRALPLVQNLSRSCLLRATSIRQREAVRKWSSRSLPRSPHCGLSGHLGCAPRRLGGCPLTSIKRTSLGARSVLLQGHAHALVASRLDPEDHVLGVSVNLEPSRTHGFGLRSQVFDVFIGHTAGGLTIRKAILEPQVLSAHTYE